MEKTINLPFFDGFYHTIHWQDESDILENELMEWYKQANWWNIDLDFANDFVTDNFNFNKYYTDYSKEYVESFISDFQHYILNYLGINNIKFISLESPKYYNYATDTIVISLELNTQVLKEYLAEKWYFNINNDNYLLFRKYLKV